MPTDTKTKEFQNKSVNDYCQTDIGSRNETLQKVQHVATVKHMMKILYISFGRAVTRNSFGRTSLTFVAGT